MVDVLLVEVVETVVGGSVDVAAIAEDHTFCPARPGAVATVGQRLAEAVTFATFDGPRTKLVKAGGSARLGQNRPGAETIRSAAD